MAIVELLCSKLQAELSLWRVSVEAPEHRDPLCGRRLRQWLRMEAESDALPKIFEKKEMRIPN